MNGKFGAQVVAMLLAISTAHAAVGVAQLSQVQGKVLISHGKGFEPANGLVALSPGDKVMVGKESSATLSYVGANCTVTIAPSSVVTVSEIAPCKAGEVVGAVNSAIVIPAQDGEGEGEGGQNVVLYGLLAAAVGIGICIAVCDDHKNPISPF